MSHMDAIFAGPEAALTHLQNKIESIRLRQDWHSLTRSTQSKEYSVKERLATRAPENGDESDSWEGDSSNCYSENSNDNQCSGRRFRISQENSSPGRGRLKNSLHPKGPGTNDCKRLDRCLNILTSLPIIALGQHIRRKSEGQTLYGWSVVLVGVAATAYHSSSGRLRTFLRKADYYTISASSVALTRALAKKAQKKRSVLRAALSLGCIPFKPSLVTACHSALAEVEVQKTARSCEVLQACHRRHCAALGAGLSLFAIEDFAIRHNVHLTHSLWHCLAAYSMATMTPLVLSKN